MYSRVFTSIFSTFIFLLYLVNTVVYGQSGSTTGAIKGTILDQQQAVIAGATITAKHLQTNTMREVRSDENGNYNLLQLLPGDYEVKIVADGFLEQVEKVEVVLGNVVKIESILSVVGTSEDIIIKGHQAYFEDRTESSTNILQNQIQSLPINQRNFLDFALTSPRVTVDRLPPNGTTSTSGLSFNGQSSRLNNVTVDGSTNNEAFTGGVRSTFSQEAVQEFQIVSDSYSAEFGRAVGGVVNIVTRSGGNDFHGTLFGFIRNDSISARDAFASFKPEFKQCQAGATISGPIKKDKAFFFASFERLSLKQNNIVTIPDSIVVSARRLGFPEVSNGPIPFSVGTTNVLAKSDFILSSTDKLSVRYNGGFKYDGNFETIGQFAAGLQSPTTSGVQRLGEHSGNINNLFFKGNIVNETRFLYNVRDQNVQSNDFGQPLVLLISQVGQITFGNNFLLPQKRFQRISQIVNNTSIQLNKHVVKFGIDYNYTSLPDKRSAFTINQFGSYFFVPLDFSVIFGNPAFPFISGEQNFDPTLRTPQQRAFLMGLAQQLSQQGFPLLPLADLPLPIEGAQVFGDPRVSVTQKLFSGFVQDDYKFRSNLVIKAGIRYDIFRETFIPINSGNISPRVAFAYNPKNLPKLTVRGAYGIFFGGAPAIQQAFIIGVYDVNKRENAPAIDQIFPFPFSLLEFNNPLKRFPSLDVLPPALKPFQLTQTYSAQPDLRAAYSHQATLGFNYLISKNTQVFIEYNYVRGLKLYSNRYINPVVRPIPFNPIASGITGRVNTTQGTNFEIESAFDSYYNGLTIQLQRRLASKINFLASYTVSKTIDNYFDFRTDLEGEQDPLNPRGERSLSIQDVRGRFVGSGTWDLSYTKNPFLRDFQFSTIIDASSGRPFNLTAGSDINMNQETVPLDRPFGVSRNAGRTPGFASVDFRITRNFIIKDAMKFQFTLEFFNAFNRVNISAFNNVYPTTLPPQENGRYIVTPDRYTNSFRPRQLQLSLRFSF